MNANQPNKITTLLFNPFYYVAGGKALAMGLTAILGIGLLCSLKNIHFDGALEAHTGAPAPLWMFLIQGIINWFCMAVVLWVFGRIFARSYPKSMNVLG